MDVNNDRKAYGGGCKFDCMLVVFVLMLVDVSLAVC